MTFFSSYLLSKKQANLTLATIVLTVTSLRVRNKLQ